MSQSTAYRKPPKPGPMPGQGPIAKVGAVESQWLTDAGRELRDRIRELQTLIRSQAREGERIGALTPDVLTALDTAGIYRMTMPIEWGGTALGARDLVEVVAGLRQIICVKG